MEKYLYEEKKDYMADIRDFFEGLDLSQINKADSIKINMLKNTWTEFYLRYVDAEIHKEAVPVIGEIFILSNSVDDVSTKASLLDYAYDYIDELKYEDVFCGTVEEDIDNMLNEAGLLTIEKYIEGKEQLEEIIKK